MLFFSLMIPCIKKYEDKGKFNFLYQIPQILYSTIISKFIDSFIRNFALTQDNIVKLKLEKEKERKYLKQKHKKLLQVLKCKFILFFFNLYSFNISLVLYNMLLWNIYKYSNTFD